MSQPSAKVLLDSVTEDGDRITTVEVTHHRFILAEVNTHRALSRNSASSRAIPLDKMMKRFVNDPAYPAVWRAEQSGMSGGADLRKKDEEKAYELFHAWNWDTARTIRDYIQALKEQYGEDWKKHALHKSWINRLMEPMQWHTAIWTFDHNLLMNLINQRLHEAAQPEFYELMKVLKPALEESEPQTLRQGQWHMPLIRKEDSEDLLDWVDHNIVELADTGVSIDEYVLSKLRKISVGRCCRVSYLTHHGVRDIAEDIRLHDFLASQDPPHASPFEHVCTPALWNKNVVYVPQLGQLGKAKPYHVPKIGNLYGWLQMRHAIGMP